MLKQLSGLDSMFLYLENTRTPLEVSSLQIYDPSSAPEGSVSFEEIMATFGSRLDLASIFRRKLLEVPFSLDHPYWVEDEDFDIEYHIRHISLPKPGDWRQLMIQVSRLQSQHLDKTRPLWEVYVIDGLDDVEGLAQGSFGLFIKMHHASVDGVSGREIQAAIHDLEPIPAHVPEGGLIRQKTFVPVPTDWSLVAKSPVNNVRKVISLARGVAGALPGLIQAGIAGRRKPTSAVPKTVFNVGRATANRVVDGRFLDLHEVKSITHAVPGTTINDAVLTIVGGALMRYLSNKARLPKASLVAGCPVNVRAGDGCDEEKDNMVSMMTTSMHTDVHDPLERMRAIHQSTTEAKELINTMGSTTLIEIPMNLPAPLAKNLFPPLVELLARTGRLPFNTIVSNVPGLQQPIYLAGARMTRFLGMGPVVDQSGLFHTAFSYDGAMSIGFTACREMMTDPAYYAQCIQQAYDELLQAALGVPPGKAVKKPGSESARKVVLRRRKAARVQPAVAASAEQTTREGEASSVAVEQRKIPLSRKSSRAKKSTRKKAIGKKPARKKRVSQAGSKKSARKNLPKKSLKS